MADPLSKATTQAKELWKKLPPRRRLVFVGATLAVLALIGFTTLRSPTERYATLFAGLSTEDAGQVVEKLRADKVPYRIEAGGSAIAVPERRVHELRLSLAQNGLPRGGGVGFEVFDKQSFGTSSFVEQMNFRRAMQGELQRTILAIDAVEGARVHVAMRERSLYRREDDPPSASVALRLKPGRVLDAAQVRGIVHLVASSVEGLSPERVTVLDETGRVLSGDEDTQALGSQRDLERTLARRAEEVVEKIVGPGHAAVVVTAELDQSRVDRTEEIYDKDRAVVRSETIVRDGASADQLVGGVAGARGNLPGAPAPSTTPIASGGAGSSSETRNFEISRIVSHTVGPKVTIKRLHVAVLVDAAPAEKGGAPVPRTDAELARLAALAKQAVGWNEERGDRIEVHSVPFAVPTEELAPTPVAAAAPKGWPLSRTQTILAAAGAGALLLLVAAIAVVRARRRRLRAKPDVLPRLPAKVGEVEAALPGATPAPPALAAPPARGTRERVIDLVRADAARSARVLAGWMAEKGKPA